MKNTTEKIIAFITTLLTIMMLTGLYCQGQSLPIQDCCQQAIELNGRLNVMTGKYNEAVRLLNETRQVGDKLIEQKNGRIEAVADQANTKLTTANQLFKNEQKARMRSDSLLNLARSKLREEFLRPRPFGFGRKKFVNELLKKLE